MRSHDTNLSSTDSTRHQTRPIGISVTSTTTATTKNQPTTTTITTITDATVSTTPNDIYQHVYHDDSSTHGSRTLDSRFSRDKYDLSGASTDEDHDEEQQNIPNQSNEQTQQPMNGSVSSSPPRPPPTSLPIPQPTSPIKTMPILDKPITDIEQSINSKRENELHELDKSKSPGIENILCTHVHDDEEEEEEEEEKEDNSESNHKTENRVCVEIYHNDNNKNSKNEENKDENEPVKRYSTSLKMYLSTRNSAGGSHSICVTPNVTDLMNKKQEEDEQQKLLSKRSQQQQRSHSLQIERTLSIDLTHSPSSSSSSSSLLEPPNAEYLIGSNICDDNNGEYLRVTTTPPMVIEIRSKPHSLPRMTNYIEYVDRRTLPPINSLSWQDDTITNDQIIPLYEKESPEDSMELVRQVIESILTQIVEEERQLIATVDRLVEQACSRAISLYIMECRAQLFAGSSHVPHHKSCILRAVKTNKNHDNDSNANNLASRLRTKSSPVITTTTDWTDVSRKLAAQTCFAAFPSGNNIHELNRSDFSTFSDAKLKFFNIISNDVVPSQSSISLPPLLSASFAPNVVSSSSSTRSSRASSTSSYASSMHVPCPPVIDSHLKRYQRPLSARLLDLSDDSDSNPTASISTSLKTCIIPTTVSNPNPSLPPPVRAQRRLQQQQKRRSTEDLNSSSDDSLSNHLNKAAGFRSVFVQRNHHNK
ncbi:unnamed protein product [Rotaria magnacalcarata]|uniref:Uncharacterized protein n=1 Tax=Rotaria magnacalcarata TaxID=392030 RepID=A0A8S2Z6P0_9BILA|nr:unnamed protein product [Rotaria magnacalcarata]CAF4603938.1 unnamed protein product [Rotaria magnacalcarata]